MTEAQDHPPSGDEEIKLIRIPSGREGKFIIGTKAKDERGGRGFQQADPNPYMKQWAECFNGRQPIVDIGCAYGLNTEAAANLMAQNDASQSSITILAADFDDSHLKYVSNLRLSCVETVHCKLPTELPTAK